MSGGSRRLETCVRALLDRAPAPFRNRHAEEFLETHRRRVADARARGRRATLRTVVSELAGTGWLVLRLRRAAGRRAMDPKGGGGGMRRMTMDRLLQDVRFSVRTLRRNPGFALAAVGVLALGIGASTAIFSAANAFFFRPLPFREPDRLVALYETNPEFDWDEEAAVQAAPANAVDWRERVEAFEDVAMYRDFGLGDVTLATDAEPVVVGGTSVTGNFFDVLGVRPALGRGFRPEETWAGESDVVVISHDLWVTRFGADPGVVGRTLVTGSGRSLEIVGVMPDGFRFPHDDTALWLTYGWEPGSLAETQYRRAHFVRPVARLADGVGLAEADAQLQSVVAQLQEEYPATNRVMGAELVPLRDFLVRGVETPMKVLLGAAMLLLLLASVNVANLMLVRASDRAREVALRHAIGASHGRVVRQMLTESLVLAGAGGALGLGVGWLGVRAMGGLTRLGIAGATELALDARVVAFAFLTATLSGVLFGVAPALHGANRGIQQTLRAGGRGLSSGRRTERVTGLLVSVEVGLALLLVVGAGLMIRSFWLLRSVDPGFRVDEVLAVEIALPPWEEPNRAWAFLERVTEALEARPGIERAGLVASLPLTEPNWSSQFQAEGWPPDRVGFEIVHRAADAAYFDALDIPLVRGRLFGPTTGWTRPRSWS